MNMSDETRNKDDQSEEFEIDLGSMDDTELVEFESLLVEEYGNIRGSESFSVAEKDELAAVVAMIKEVRGEMAFRAETEDADDFVAASVGKEFLAKKTAKAEELAEEEVVEEEEEEVKPAAEEELAEEEDEVTISPRGLDGDVPAEKVEKKAFNVVASADIRGFTAGSDLQDWSGVARAFVAKRPDIRGTDKGADGNRFLVASVLGEFPEERVLGADLDSNMGKINKVASEEAIVASGGLCAPLTPYYQLTTYGDAHRPVRDALPVFKAERGGIRFMPAPVLTDLAGSTRHTTAAEDAAGYTNQDPAGSTAPKPCLHVTCEVEQSSVIEAIHRCLTFGNMGARTYPEQVESWIKLGMSEFSRYAETRLIDEIDANSTALTAAQVFGATFSLLEQVALVVTSFRARHRLSSRATFRALMPFWVTEIVKSDLAAQAPGDGLGRYSISDAQVSDWFAARGINVTFYQDNSTAAGAPFAAPGAGALWGWPTDVEWFLYPEGSFLYLDGGTLDLGLVRDSTLNSTNDYQIFYEEFNTVTFIGIESYKVTSTVCANGEYAPAGSARVCPTS
jgi:hypothetical protein